MIFMLCSGSGVLGMRRFGRASALLAMYVPFVDYDMDNVGSYSVGRAILSAGRL